MNIIDTAREKLARIAGLEPTLQNALERAAAARAEHEATIEREVRAIEAGTAAERKRERREKLEAELAELEGKTGFDTFRKGIDADVAIIAECDRKARAAIKRIDEKVATSAGLSRSAHAIAEELGVQANAPSYSLQVAQRLTHEVIWRLREKDGDLQVKAAEWFAQSNTKTER